MVYVHLPSDLQAGWYTSIFRVIYRLGGIRPSLRPSRRAGWYTGAGLGVKRHRVERKKTRSGVRGGWVVHRRRVGGPHVLGTKAQGWMLHTRTVWCCRPAASYFDHRLTHNTQGPMAPVAAAKHTKRARTRTHSLSHTQTDTHKHRVRCRRWWHLSTRSVPSCSFPRSASSPSPLPSPPPHSPIKRPFLSCP